MWGYGGYGYGGGYYRRNSNHGGRPRKAYVFFAHRSTFFRSDSRYDDISCIECVFLTFLSLSSVFIFDFSFHIWRWFSRKYEKNPAFRAHFSFDSRWDGCLCDETLQTYTYEKQQQKRTDGKGEKIKVQKWEEKKKGFTERFVGSNGRRDHQTKDRRVSDQHGFVWYLQQISRSDKSTSVYGYQFDVISTMYVAWCPWAYTWLTWNDVSAFWGI